MGEAANTKKKGLTRLSAFEVEEVSLVDAGANNRPLLIVKSKDSEGTMGASAAGGTEVKPDGKGGVVPVAKNEGGTQAAPELTLSAARKAALTKTITEAATLLKALETQVNGAKVAEGSEVVPAEIAKNLGSAATLLLDVAPEDIAKAGHKQFTGTRLTAIQEAAARLNGLLGDVQPAAPAPAAAAPAQAAPAVNEETTKAVNELGKSMKELQTSVTSTLQTMEKALLTQGEQIKAQGEAVTKQAGKLKEMEGVRGASNGTSEPAPVIKAKPKRTSWPSDLGTEANEKKKQEQGRS